MSTFEINKNIFDFDEGFKFETYATITRKDDKINRFDMVLVFTSINSTQVKIEYQLRQYYDNNLYKYLFASSNSKLFIKITNDYLTQLMGKNWNDEDIKNEDWIFLNIQHSIEYFAKYFNEDENIDIGKIFYNDSKKYN